MTLQKMIPKQNINHLEEKANFIVSTYDTYRSHQIDLEHIISQHSKIRVLYMNQDSKVVMKKNRAIIIIDNKLSYRKQREQLAEEFCHALLHCGNQTDKRYSLMLDKQESQSKRMSAYLLCPMSRLRQQSIVWDTYCTTQELADIFNVTPEFMNYRLSLIFGQDLDTIAYHDGDFYGYIPVK